MKNSARAHVVSILCVGWRKITRKRESAAEVNKFSVHSQRARYQRTKSVTTALLSFLRIWRSGCRFALSCHFIARNAPPAREREILSLFLFSGRVLHIYTTQYVMPLDLCAIIPLWVQHRAGICGQMKKMDRTRASGDASRRLYSLSWRSTLDMLLHYCKCCTMLVCAMTRQREKKGVNGKKNIRVVWLLLRFSLVQSTGRLYQRYIGWLDAILRVQWKAHWCTWLRKNRRFFMSSENVTVWSSEKIRVIFVLMHVWISLEITVYTMNSA